MLRRLFLTVTLLLAIPALAKAWTLPVSVTNTTAGINAGNKATVTVGNVSTDVAVGTTYFYPANTVTSVSVAIANVENVASIKLNGVAQPLATPVVVQKTALALQTLNIVYSTTNTSLKYDATVIQAAGGVTSLSIGSSSTTNKFTSVPKGTAIIINAQPNSGNKVTGITLTDTNGAITTPYSSTSAISQVFTLNATTTVAVSYAVDPKINAILTVPASAGIGVQIQATTGASSNVSPINYAYATTCSGESQAASTNSSFSFTPNAIGSCDVTVTVTAGAATPVVKTATVSVTSVVASANFVCTSCHSNSSPEIVAAYNGSPHVTVTSCQNCHTSSPHGAALPTSVVCAGCHVSKFGQPSQHATSFTGTTCIFCHNPHAAVAEGSMPSGAHFNNITGGMYPASYVTSRSECSNCHVDTPANAAIRQQWGASGHADTRALPWIDYDFKTRTECVRCHTTTGFIAYSSAKVTTPWGTDADKYTKEVLTCIGCHSNVAAGTVRTITPNKPYADETGFTNHSVGTSNICMDCHTGRNNGQSIQVKVGTADFANLAYIAPHYLTAGGSLQGKSGFHFPGKTYTNYSSNVHRQVGRENAASTGTDGPCVTCHMSAPDKHSFSPVTTDQAGMINAVTTTVCTNCHNSMPANTLDASRMAFNTALDVLKVQLQDKGFTYSPNYPYFAAKNWGSGQAGANVMGAAFNYKLFAAEPGAYTHSPDYAKQLIIDSIVAVANNGDINGAITIDAAINALYGSGKITLDQFNSINGYKTSDVKIPVNCSACHPNLGGSHAAHVGTLLSQVTAYGVADPIYSANSSDTQSYKFGCAYCHPYVNANHTNGVIALSGNGYAGTTKTNITCATSLCHSDGKGTYVTSPNWYAGFVGADKCAMCHAATPATGSHPAHTSINGIHDGSSNITYAANFRCVKCHASTVDGAKNINYANHVNGTVNVAFVAASEVSKAQISAVSFNKYSTVWTRTGAVDTSKNFLSAGSYSAGTCSTIACHNNGTTPAWGSGQISCVACHSQL